MKKNNFTPHIKYVDGIWYCVDASRPFYGMGFDAASAYDDWNDVCASFAHEVIAS